MYKVRKNSFWVFALNIGQQIQVEQTKFSLTDLVYNLHFLKH